MMKSRKNTQSSTSIASNDDGDDDVVGVAVVVVVAMATVQHVNVYIIKVIRFVMASTV